MANERARVLRRNKTRAERLLWNELRSLKGLGFKFRQQVPIDHYIVDFACLSKRLIVEVDGAIHGTEDERSRDAERERYLRAQGFAVLRVWNSDVYRNIEGVMTAIVGALGTPTPNPSPRRAGGSPPARWGGERGRKRRSGAHP